MSRRIQFLFVGLVVLGAAAAAEAQRSTAGRAKVALTGADIKVSGEYPTTLCGGPYMLGAGVSFQAKAGDWQITVASQNRTSGKVPLNNGNRINVVVTANGPGKSLVRGPANGGSLTISPDFKTADADLELRNVIGKDTARLVATFTCQ